MAITVSSQDVLDAEAFLVEFLEDNVEEGDYSDGSSLRDLAVKAISFVVAYLKKTDAQIRARQSLKSIEEVDVSDDAEAADDAADAIISNWFATRNQGTFARVIAYGHITERVDVTVPANAVFYKTSTLGFILDNEGDNLHVPAESLLAQYDSTGAIIDFVFKFPLMAEQPGTDYEVAPGNFTSFDSFNPYVTRIEILEKPVGAEDIETTTDFIARSQNLVTVRNLINARSCDAVLRDEFAEIRTLDVVGMGDPEMIRDLVVERATGLQLHVGGHQDIFVDTPTNETFFSGEVGGFFTRPDGIVCVFRDATYADYDAVTNPTGHRFTVADPVTGKTLAAGMALRIYTGLGDDARDYNIHEVRETELHVSLRIPFHVATDEQNPITYVTWSAGQLAPNYADVVPQQLTGETSKVTRASGRITLPGGPLYAIKEVTIASDTDPDANPEDGLIHFHERVNHAPVEQVAPDNEFQVIVHNPQEHQSSRSFAEVIIGIDGNLSKYDGQTLKVTYDTLTGFSTISSYVVDRRRRISAENPLVRAYHPVYLKFVLEYGLKNSATEDIDEAAAAQVLIDMINSFSPSETIDVSTITTAFRATYASVGQVYPFVIEYDVHLPDGRVIPFETTDKVTVPQTTEAIKALLVYPDSDVDGFTNPVTYGLSDDVMRYLALSGDVVVQKRT